MYRKLSLTAIAAITLLASNAATLLFIGDSITDGNWGSPSGYPCWSDQRNQWDQNHILGHGYVEMTAGKLMSEGPQAGWKVINRGISGNTFEDINRRWEKDVIFHNPDMVSLLVGTNDVHYYLDGDRREPFDIEKWENRLDSLVESNIARITSMVLCTPFVAKVGDVGQREDYAERERLVNELTGSIRRVATRHGVQIVDFNRMVGELTDGDSPSYWVWDGIHPTTACHYRMSQLWLRSVMPEKFNQHSDK